MLVALILCMFSFPRIFGMNGEQPPAAAQITEDTQQIGGAHMLDSFLNRRFLRINHKPASLREIYGDIQPTPMNFKIGQHVVSNGLRQIPTDICPWLEELDELCAEKVYIDRELIHRQLNYKATPSRIATMILANRGTPAPQVTVISGYSKSGKTVTVTKIQWDIIEADPTVWIAHVDIPRLIRELPDPLRFSNNEEILSRVIDSAVIFDQHQIFFRNVLEINPKKVLFMFDDVDRLVGTSARSIVTILKTLSNVGTHAIIIGNPLTMEILQELQVDFNNYHLPDMNFQETRDYTRNIWVKTHIFRKSWSTAELLQSTFVETRTSIETQRLNQYATAFAALIQQTSLPRSPGSLNALLSQSIWREFSDHLEHIFSLNPTFTIPSNIVHLKLVKNNIYKTIVQHMQMPNNVHEDTTIRVYGAVALAQIVRELEPSEDANTLIGVIQTDVMQAEQHLRGKTRRDVFVDIVEGELKFIHSDFRDYFAAHYITSELFDVDENVEVFVRRIISEPRYVQVTEFLNNIPGFLSHHRKDSSDPLRFSPFIRRSESDFSAMLDYFLAQGFSNLFLRSVDELTDRNLLAELVSYITDDTRLLLPADDARTFGMKSAQSQPPSLSQEMGLFTRLELFLLRRMKSEFDRFEEFKSAVRHTQVDYQRLALHIVTTPNFSIDLLRQIVDMASEVGYKLDFHRLLYEAINTDTSSSLPAANILSKYIFDAPAIHVNGDNLLHAAARSNNVAMLHYVINELQVPLVRDGQVDERVLELALDSNPSAHFIPDGWLEKIWLLVDQIGSTPIAPRLHRDLPDLNFEIPLPDIHAEWFKFMLGGQPEITGENNDMSAMRIYPLEAVELEQNIALMRLRPTSAWGLSSETLALRRKFLMMKLRRFNPQVSFAEMMVHYKEYYKGKHTLNSAERTAYRSLISTLLSWEHMILTTEDRIRILDSLADNVVTLDDCHDLQYVAQRGLVTHSLVESHYREILERLRQSGVAPTAGIMPAELLQSSLNARPNIASSSLAPDVWETEEPFLHRARPSRPQISRCIWDEFLFNRRQRRAAFDARCLFSWNEVQQFNDAEQPRVLSQIRINSDRFLQMIRNVERVDPAQASQLLAFVDELMRGELGFSVITGQSRLLLRDVVQHGGFLKYQQNTRLTEAILDTTQRFGKSSSTAGLSLIFSRRPVLYGAMMVPLIRALFGTVDTCMQRRNDSACLQASGFLALGMALPVSGFLAARYVPWIIQSWTATALELLPASAPNVLRENTMLIRKYGVRFGPRAIGIGLTAVGVAFDLFNIVQVSKMLDMCSGNAAACSDKEKIDMAISLTFSCVSIALTITLLATGVGVMAGVMVGVALMAVEMLLMGINEVLYHKNKYETTVDENFRIFFRRIVWMSPPADVQALERRADWIDALAEHGWKLMEDGGDNIVAYAVGIGNLTAETAIAGFSDINMASYSEKNSRNLSRVLPKVHRSELVPMCLPKRPEFAPYEEISSVVDTAVFGCYNSFVLMHKERSQRGFSDSSTILYDLEYVESGTIRGNDILNNMYLLGNSSARLILYSSYKTTNTFILHSEFFRGTICLTRSSRAVLDVSAVPSTHLKFSWETIHGIGLLYFGVSPDDPVLVHGQSRMQPNLHFIGRKAKPDTVICDFSQNFRIHSNVSSISVDAGGGSENTVDRLYDCKTTIVRPFTHIYGSSSSEVTYTPYVWLSMGTENAPNVVHATIHPMKSKFVVTFVHQPLFYNLISVRYVRSAQTLVLRLVYSLSEVMELTVTDYTSFSTPGAVDSSRNGSGNCIFVDSYNHMIVDSVIDSDMDGAEVTRFNALVTINSTVLRDVQHQYLTLNAIQPKKFAVVTKFFEPESSTAFIFGAWTNDRFLIDNSTLFFYGGNGNDVYVLERGSPKRVWLSNEASDEEWDVLVLPDSRCKLLSTSCGTKDTQLTTGSAWDVEISCWESTTAADASLVVVVRSFLLDRQFQHLVVHWNDSIRALLPTIRGEDEGVEFAAFFSFWGSVSLTLTSGEENLVLNGTSEGNPAVVYRSGPSDVVLTTKFFSTSRSSFVMLKDFFTDGDISEVSLIWRDFEVFLFGEGAKSPRVFNASDIQTFAFLSEFADEQSFIQEYRVNVTGQNTTVVIEHNNSTDVQEQQLGVLILFEAEPKDVLSIISGQSLMLWVRGTSISVKNWCLSPLHRLYRIEFMHSRTMTPLTLHHLTHLSCAVSNNSIDAEVILELRARLRSAQQQFELELGDDEFRLTLCLSSILADTLAQQPMYELLGFASAVNQASFIRDNCYVLFTSQSISTASLRPVKIFLESTMQSLMTKEQPIERIQKGLNELSDACWEGFIASLCNRTYEDFEFIGDVINAVLPCVSDLKNYINRIIFEAPEQWHQFNIYLNTFV